MRRQGAELPAYRQGLELHGAVLSPPLGDPERKVEVSGGKAMRRLVSGVIAAGLLVAAPWTGAEPLATQEVRAIAKEAYVYGFPIVDSYRILYSYFVDRDSPEYKAGWNERVANNARV